MGKESDVIMYLMATYGCFSGQGVYSSVLSGTVSSEIYCTFGVVCSNSPLIVAGAEYSEVSCNYQD
jgi:hypothetical protein